MKITMFGLILLTTTFTAVLCLGKEEDNEPSNDTLVLLHVLFRHGDRTPEGRDSYKNDPYINETYYPIGLSQLTTKGKGTAYKIGSDLRKRYDAFLGHQYTSKTCYARTTDYKRTKMTLELVLASLYPPTSYDLFNKNLDWQPIPYIYESINDFMLAAPHYCINYIFRYFNHLMSDEGQAKIKDFKQIYWMLSKYTGNDIKTPLNVLEIYTTLVAEEGWGLELPSWTKEIYPDKLEKLAAVEYVFQSATTPLKRFGAGFLLKKILDDTKSKINGSLNPERKIFLYSAHEYNVAVMLRTLDVFDLHVPPFGAIIIFEIHRINDIYGLKLYYQNYTTDKPMLLTIPGCNSFCPYDALYKLVEEKLPTKSDVCVTSGEQ